MYDIDLMDTEVMEGDFVVVKVAGKSRVLNFIARVDVVDDLEYQGVFRRKVPTRTSDRPTFVLSTKDIASFQAEDILDKLSNPTIIGGSARLENKFTFSCSIDKWNIN